jgi:ubiquinone/menaquinone biosynthesis C-methylase UbiE
MIIASLSFSSFQLNGQNTVNDPLEERQNKLQPPDKVLDAIGIKEGMTIGEIGAGKGRYAVLLAERVGNSGKIYANDINKKSLDYLENRCKHSDIRNIETIFGTVTDPKFPLESLDLAFMINTYHHLDQPVELMKNIKPGLKSNGILAIVEHEPTKSERVSCDHCSTPKDVLIKQAVQAGYELIRIETFLEEDNIYIFRVNN